MRPCEAACAPVENSSVESRPNTGQNSCAADPVAGGIQLKNSVRFSYKIKRGGRKRPSLAHKAPQCGAFPGFGQVVAKIGLLGFGWSWTRKSTVL